MTTTRFIGRLRYSRSYWSRVTRMFSDWRWAAHAEGELLGLSDRCLKDIGISRHTSQLDSGKPFWMA
jgi:uncharacterized protein YjiS (DUF1127 family)